MKKTTGSFTVYKNEDGVVIEIAQFEDTSLGCKAAHKLVETLTTIKENLNSKALIWFYAEFDNDKTGEL